jgi:O6-methylguanine-DNA--protein-cysteine methyltransferase
MRLYFSQITIAVISRMFRLIGIDIIYVPFYSSDLKTPIGRLLIKGNKTNIYSINFSDEVMDNPSSSLTEQAKQQLQDYFHLTRCHFTFPMLQVGTSFQQAV